MNKLLFIVPVFISLFWACKTSNKNNFEKISVSKVAYQSFGKKITSENVLTKNEILNKYMHLKKGDTLQIKFASSINSVCKKKGCWMKLDLGNNKETMVQFKDYSFFMPLDADNKEVIVNGNAFITEVSVKELQHYAEDGGKSKEEIAQITKPKITYMFEANGVLLKK